MLETSRLELEELKRELEALRISSTELLAAAENSQTELTALGAALRKAESSLMSLELSFAAYREAAEGRIKTLSKEKRLWKWGCIAAGVLAAGFGTAFFVGR
jgi:predicted  nucleic acid-binding Zn-ribbon protein